MTRMSCGKSTVIIIFFFLATEALATVLILQMTRKARW